MVFVDVLHINIYVVLSLAGFDLFCGQDLHRILSVLISAAGRIYRGREGRIFYDVKNWPVWTYEDYIRGALTYRIMLSCIQTRQGRHTFPGGFLEMSNMFHPTPNLHISPIHTKQRKDHPTLKAGELWPDLGIGVPWNVSLISFSCRILLFSAVVLPVAKQIVGYYIPKTTYLHSYNGVKSSHGAQVLLWDR